MYSKFHLLLLLKTTFTAMLIICINIRFNEFINFSVTKFCSDLWPNLQTWFLTLVNKAKKTFSTQVLLQVRTVSLTPKRTVLLPLLQDKRNMQPIFILSKWKTQNLISLGLSEGSHNRFFSMFILFLNQNSYFCLKTCNLQSLTTPSYSNGIK